MGRRGRFLNFADRFSLHLALSADVTPKEEKKKKEHKKVKEVDESFGIYLAKALEAEGKQANDGAKKTVEQRCYIVLRCIEHLRRLEKEKGGAVEEWKKKADGRMHGQSLNMRLLTFQPWQKEDESELFDLCSRAFHFFDGLIVKRRLFSKESRDFFFRLLIKATAKDLVVISIEMKKVLDIVWKTLGEWISLRGKPLRRINDELCAMCAEFKSTLGKDLITFRGGRLVALREHGLKRRILDVEGRVELYHRGEMAREEDKRRKIAKKGTEKRKAPEILTVSDSDSDGSDSEVEVMEVEKSQKKKKREVPKHTTFD